MAWIGIADSGLAYTFTDYATGVVMAGSVVSAADISSAFFQVYFDVAQSPDVSVRITVQSYSAATIGLELSTVGGAFFTFNGSGGQEQVVNTEPDAELQTAFTPAQFSGLVFDEFYYEGARGVESDASETFSFLVEVEVDVEPPPPAVCEEIGRATRAYVTAYSLARTVACRMQRGQRRCLVAIFNGAIPVGRALSSVKWQSRAWSVVMSDAVIDGRSSSVMVFAQGNGGGWVKCTATLDNGEIYTQVFDVMVVGGPWFDNEPAQVTGPTELVVVS